MRLSIPRCLPWSSGGADARGSRALHPRSKKKAPAKKSKVSPVEEDEEEGELK